MQSSSHERARSRTRCAGGRNRRWTGRVPSRWARCRRGPGRLREPVGLAIATPQQVHKGVFGQVVHRVLLRRSFDPIGGPGIVDDRVGTEAHLTLGGDDPAAPVAETVAISFDGDGRVDHEVIGFQEVGYARVVDAQRQDHRSGLRTVVPKLKTDSDFHLEILIYCIVSIHSRPGGRLTGRPRFPGGASTSRPRRHTDAGIPIGLAHLARVQPGPRRFTPRRRPIRR